MKRARQATGPVPDYAGLALAPASARWLHRHGYSAQQFHRLTQDCQPQGDAARVAYAFLTSLHEHLGDDVPFDEARLWLRSGLPGDPYSPLLVWNWNVPQAYLFALGEDAATYAAAGYNLRDAISANARNGLAEARTLAALRTP